MKELSTDINLDEEVAHMAEFIRQKWTPIENIEALFTEIRDAALHAARAWLHDHDIWDVAHDMLDARKALLEEKLKDSLPVQSVGVEYYDALCTLVYDISGKAKRLKEAGMDIDGPWDFSRRVNALSNRLSAKYPDLATARPNGWAEFEKGYTEYDGQAEYDPKPDRELFKGSKVEGACSGSFPMRVALPYVMYDEKAQGFKAYRVLVGAVFAQFLGIKEMLNTEELKQALKALPGMDEPTMVFERKVATDNPLLSVLFKMARPCPKEAAYLAACKSQAEYAMLSDEEKAALEAKHEDKIQQILDRLKSSGGGEEDRKKREASKLNLVNLLNEAFAAV